jgi:hypothetical protein
MSLSVYDPVKNCFVLKPMTTITVNAFHPDYMKTHEPNFMKDFRTHEANRQAAATLSKHVEKVRLTKPSHGTLFGISDKVVDAHMMRPKQMMQRPKSTELEAIKKKILEPKEFHTFQKAGMPKTRSQMMTEVVAKKRKTDVNWGTVLPNSKNIPTTKSFKEKK